MLTYKITLPDLPHPVLLVKIAYFGHFILLDRMNSFFRLISTKTRYFFIFGCWLLPEKISFCPKNNGFTSLMGYSPPWLVHLWVTLFKNSLSLRLFKSDPDEIWQKCSSVKNASIDGFRFLTWQHTLKMATVMSTRCPLAHGVRVMWLAVCTTVPDPYYIHSFFTGRIDLSVM